MAKFAVTIGGRIMEKTISIEAVDKEQALQKVEEEYKDGSFGESELAIWFFKAEQTNL
jgi:hypothetical protein